MICLLSRKKYWKSLFLFIKVDEMQTNSVLILPEIKSHQNSPAMLQPTQCKK